MASIHPPSPLRTTTTYSPSSSPTNIRAPPLPSPTRNSSGLGFELTQQSSRGWSNADNGTGLGARRPISSQYSTESLGNTGGRTSPESMRKAGAGGGSEAIGERRRQSNSFKTMSTGSLVSNSPFTKRLGSTNAPPPPVPTLNGMYSNSFVPNNKAPERKVSGRSNSRNNSGDLLSTTNENLGGPRKLSSGEKDFDDSTPPRSASVSPSLPFRPVRNTTGTSPAALAFDSTSTSSAAPAGSTPYKSNWGIVAPRQSSSYAASRKNALVSSSPFVNRTPSITNFHDESAQTVSTPGLSFSPEERAYSSSTMSTFNSGMGLGIRPGGPLAIAERRIAGSSIPPPSTPPSQERNGSLSSSPSSALSLSRRGMKGPRALSIDQDDFGHPQEEFERDQSGRYVRRKPSAKTVTWATTEEVLEFDVESERSRSSDVSIATNSDEGQLSDGGEGRSFEYDEGNSSMGFEEGGSVEVHNLVHSDDDVSEEEENDNYSAVSSASTVEDMMGEIEAFMDNPSPQIDLGPRLTFDLNQRELDLASLSHALPSSPKKFSSASLTTTAAIRTASGASNDSTIIKADEDDTGSAYSEDDYGNEDAGMQDQADRAVEAASTMFADFSAELPQLTIASLSTASPAPQLSPYSLPSLPNSSPLIGFIEREDTTDSHNQLTSLTATILPPAPFHSTPTKATTSFESPLASPFASASSTPGPTHLSRHASILESEPYGASLGSVRGSLRGAGKLRQGKEKFDEKLRLHQAILAGGTALPLSPSTSLVSPTFSDARSPPSSTTPTFPTLNEEIAESNETEEPIIITARPALKARTATISSEMLTNLQSPRYGSKALLGGTLTAEVANGMVSPWNDFNEEFQVEWDGFPPPVSSTPSTVVTHSSPFSQVVQSPDSTATSEFSFVDDDEGNTTSMGDLSVSQEQEAISSSSRKQEENISTEARQWGRKGSARRSLSAGDASTFDPVSSSTDKRATMPESGFAQRLNSALPSSTSSFSLSTGSSLDNVYRNSQHPKYRVRETKKVVYANDGLLTTIGEAGDVDPGRAWRKKRPSDMNASMTSDELRSAQEPGSLSGQIFVSLIDVHFDELPIPSEPTSVVCWLDNGRQRVPAGTFTLGPRIKLKKEFELTSSAGLAFSIDLIVPHNHSINSHLLSTRPPTIPATPSSPTKSRFLSHFSSPKKKAAAALAPPPSPNPASTRLLQYLSAEGVAASVHVSFKNEASKCRMKTLRLELPFVSNSSTPRSNSGSITIELFHIPTIQGILKDDLPKSVDEAKTGIALAEKTKEVKFEGILTQMGGDCQTWRRRLMKVMGDRMVPYNEVTKKSYVEIDLSSVVAIEDPNAPVTSTSPSGIIRSTSQEFDEGSWRMDNSMNLVFRDGESILFFADTAEEKAKWIGLLGNLAGKKVREASAWAIALRAQQQI